MLFRKDRKRNIMSHGGRCFDAVFRHRKDLSLHILIGITKDPVKLVPKRLIMCRDLLVRDLELRKMKEV